MMLRTAITVKKGQDKEANDRDPQTRFLPQAIAVAVLAFLLYHAVAFTYVFYRLSQASKGQYGLTMAVNDHLSSQFPTHAVLVQKLVLLPLPNPAAKRYYESQRDFFLQAAQDFQLHPYWSTYNEATPDMEFRQVVTERVRSMYRQYQATGQSV